MLLSIALLTSPAPAADVFVSSGADLEAAILTAPSTTSPLTTIWVLPGDYRLQHMDIVGKAFEIRALVPGSVVLTNDTTSRFVDIDGASDILMRDLTIDANNELLTEIQGTSVVELQRVRLLNGDGGTNGGLVAVTNDARLTLRHADLRDGTTSSHGGLVRTSGESELIVANSRFTNGVAGAHGGCLRLAGSSATIDSTLIRGCSAEDGGGMASESPVVITNSWFQENTARLRGGGIFARGTLELNDSMVCRGTSEQRASGGVYWFGSESNRLTVDRSYLVLNQGNGATFSGAGLKVLGGGASALVSETLFWANAANDSAGLYVDSTASVSVDLSAFVSNTPNTLVNETGMVPLVDPLQYPAATLTGFTVTGLDNTDPMIGMPSSVDCAPHADVIAADSPFTDADADGSHVPFDCDDSDPMIHPAALEICDGVDNDCDFEVDEGLPTSLFYLDVDQDELGDPAFPIEACGAGHPRPDDFLSDTAAVDCPHGDPPTTLYRDADGDGYGDPTDSTTACAESEGWVTSDEDCDDTPETGAAVNPAAAEVCDGIDNNCADGPDEASAPTITYVTYHRDADGDSYGNEDSTVFTCDGAPTGFVATGTDCDDTPTGASIHPGAEEVCDGIDNNCVDGADEASAPTISYTNWYRDLDNDGYGDDAFIQSTCDGTIPAGFVAVSGDCEDVGGNATIRTPGAAEICDGVDNDCDEIVDQASSPDLFYISYHRDLDGDGRGDPGFVESSCDGSVSMGYVANDDDCDDVGPDAAQRWTDRDEDCDGIDNDCDGNVDEDILYQDWFQDLDGDGAGDPNVVTPNVCAEPSTGTWVTNGTDCDDTGPDAALRSPFLLEICDGIDNDCADGVDDGLPFTSFFLDADLDDFGDPHTAISSCSGRPAGYVVDSTDCDDLDAHISPGATEVCDGVDNNCVSGVDEGLPVVDYYPDVDLDGYGDATATASPACSDPGAGWSAEPTDCQDLDDPSLPRPANQIHPGAFEVCDGIDNNCDGLLDGDDPAALLGDWWPDLDQDGFGDTGTAAIQACSPAGLVANDFDCDDSDDLVNPLAVDDTCNGIDENCDQLADEAAPTVDIYPDADGDSFGDADGAVLHVQCPDADAPLTGTDCDDTDPDVHPDAVDDTCDGVDNDCSGVPDQDAPLTPTAVDADQDGFVVPGPPERCAPALPPLIDCDDRTSDIYPGAPEFCDGIDTDCDGVADASDCLPTVIVTQDPEPVRFRMTCSQSPGPSSFLALLGRRR